MRIKVSIWNPGLPGWITECDLELTWTGPMLLFRPPGMPSSLIAERKHKQVRSTPTEVEAWKENFFSQKHRVVISEAKIKTQVFLASKHILLLQATSQRILLGASRCWDTLYTLYTFNMLNQRDCIINSPTVRNIPSGWHIWRFWSIQERNRKNIFILEYFLFPV